MARRGYRWRGVRRAFRAGLAEWEGRSMARCYGGAYRGAYKAGRALAYLGAALVVWAVLVLVWGLAVAGQP